MTPQPIEMLLDGPAAGGDGRLRKEDAGRNEDQNKQHTHHLLCGIVGR